MTQEETLLFKSNIVANIDTSAARDALGDLKSSIEDLENKFGNVFKNVDGFFGRLGESVEILDQKIRNAAESAGLIDETLKATKGYEELVNDVKELQGELQNAQKRADEWEQSARSAWKEVNRSNEETRQTIQRLVTEQVEAYKSTEQVTQRIAAGAQQAKSEIEMLGAEIRSMMTSSVGRISGAPGYESSKSFGQMTGQSMYVENLAVTIAKFQELGLTVSEIYEKIDETIAEYAPIIASTNNKATDAIIQAWKEVLDKVIGRSYVPETLDGIAEEFGPRLKRVVGDVDDTLGRLTDQFRESMDAIGNAVLRATGPMGALQAGIKMANKQAREMIGEMMPPVLQEEFAPWKVVEKYRQIEREITKARKEGNEQRAQVLEQELADLRSKLNQMGLALDTSADKIDYAMRRIQPSIIDVVQQVGRAFKLLGAEGVGLGTSLPVVANAIADAGSRLRLFGDETEETIRKVGNFGSRILGIFGMISSRGGPSADAAMQQVGQTISDNANLMKKQQQTYSRLFEEREREIKREIRSLQERLRIAETSQREEDKLSERQKSTIKERIRLLQEEEAAMRTVYRTIISNMGTALTRLDTNSMHFLTTLKNTGKVSGERIRDMAHNMGALNSNLAEAGKVSLKTIPELQEWFKRLEGNIVSTGRSLQELEAHEMRLAVATKGMNAAFSAAGKGMSMVQSAAGRFTSIFRRGGTVDVGAREMSVGVRSSFNSVNDAVERTADNVIYSLGNLDPAFGEIAQGGMQMNYAMRDVMQGMAAVTEGGTNRMIAAFSMLKLAAGAIVGIFGGVILSATKLAAEVTTLEMTMRIVAKNADYNVEQTVRFRDALEDTGITTRAATKAMTQFMKAKLPMEWYDPIQEATYNITDLARAAQNLAVSMGGDSSETFSRFIYFIQTGNSALLDYIGISRNASHMLDEYAKTVGKTAKQLSIRERYEALIAGLMQESAQVAGVYEEAMKSANKQLGSMRRYIEQVRYEWGKHFEPILATVVMNFNKLLKAIAAVNDETKEQIAQYVTVSGSLAAVSTALTIILPKLKFLTKGVEVLGKAFIGKFSPFAIAASIALKLLGDKFSELPARSQGVAGIAERLDYLLEKLSKFKEIIQPALDWFENFMRMVRRHTTTISFRIDKFIENLKNRFDSFVGEHPEIVRFFERVKDVVSDLFDVVWHAVDRVLGAVEDLLAQDWEGFFSKLQDAGRLIAAWLLEFFNEVVSVSFEWGKNLVTSFVNGIISYARNAIPRAMSQVGDLISMFLEGHSPPKIGPLSNIGLWGTGLMSTFAESIREQKINFDESMFYGLSALSAKSKVWGENITDVFTAGILGKAREALGPAMGQVGNVIARFLEGHSPPSEGRLAEIEDWGRNVFETFLSGFQMADFGILDTGLGLIRQRLEMLVGDAENAASQIASAMMKVREVVAGAIAQARSTGGPLDLSALNELVVGPLKLYAQDIAAVLEALFAALQAEQAYQALQDQIAAAREARQRAIEEAREAYEALAEQIADAQEQRADAIKAVQDQLKNVGKEIEAIQDRKEALEEQMENEVQARLEAMGLMVDEDLLRELQRQLADASVEVRHAQRRIERVRSQAGKYGQNILTWEEINAQAQLELAQTRQDQIQDQIDEQEAIVREADRIRDELRKEYEAQFTALEEQLELAQDQAEALQDQIEAMREVDEAQRELEQDRLEAMQDRIKEMEKANQAATKAENEQLRAAQKHAADLKAHADLLQKLLAERMAAEEEYNKIVREGNSDQDENNDELEKIRQKRRQELIERLKYMQDEWVPEMPITPPTLSSTIEGWLSNIGLTLEGGMPGLVEGIREKIVMWWDGFKLTTLGLVLEDLGVIDIIEGIANRVGAAVDFVSEHTERIKAIFAGLATAAGILALPAVIGVVTGAIETLILSVMVALEGLGAAGMVATITNPWFLLAAAIGAIVFLVVDNWDKIKGFFENTVGALVNFLDELGAIEFVSMLMKQFGEWVNIVAGYFGKLVDAWEPVAKEVFGKFKQEIDELLEKFRGLGERISSIFSGVENVVGPVLGPFLDWIKNIWQEAYSIFTELVSQIIDIGQALGIIASDKSFSVIDAALNAIGATFKMIIGVASEVFQIIFDLITLDFDSLLGDFNELISEITKWATGLSFDEVVKRLKKVPEEILTIAADIVIGVKEWFDDLPLFVQKALSNLWDIISKPFKDVYDFLIGNSLVTDLIDGIVDLFTSLPKKILSVARKLFDAARKLGGQIFKGIADLVENIDDDVVTWLWSVVVEMIKLTAKFLSAAIEIGTQIYDGIKQKVDEIVTGIADWISGIVTNILSCTQDFLNSATNLGQQLVDGIKTKINEIVDKIKEWISNITVEISARAKDFLDTATILGQQIVSGIYNKIVEIVNNIGGWLSGVASSISAKAVDFWNAAVSLGSQIFNAIYDAIMGVNGLVSKVGGWISSVGTAISGKAVEIYNAALAVATNIWNAFYNLIAGENGLVNNIGDWIKSLGTSISNVASTIYNSAIIVASEIWNAFYEAVLGENGLINKIGGWIGDVAEAIGAKSLLDKFTTAASAIGSAIIDAIKSGISGGVKGIVNFLIDVWNDHLRGAFQSMVNKVIDGVNAVINLINDAASAIPGIDIYITPLEHIYLDEIPKLDAGGIITRNIIAQLHAGEVVLPLGRLADIMNEISGQRAVPAFSPTIILQGSATPAQVKPAVEQTFDWWLEKNRRA